MMNFRYRKLLVRRKRVHLWLVTWFAKRRPQVNQTWRTNHALAVQHRDTRHGRLPDTEAFNAPFADV